METEIGQSRHFALLLFLYGGLLRTFIEITHADYREANWALAAELLEGRRQLQLS